MKRWRVRVSDRVGKIDEWRVTAERIEFVDWWITWWNGGLVIAVASAENLLQVAIDEEDGK